MKNNNQEKKSLEVPQKSFDNNPDFNQFLKREILREQSIIAFSNILDFSFLDKNGVLSLRNLSSIYCSQNKNLKKTIKIKMHDKKSALNFLALYINMVEKNEEVTLQKILNLSEKNIEKLISLLNEKQK